MPIKTIYFVSMMIIFNCTCLDLKFLKLRQNVLFSVPLLKRTNYFVILVVCILSAVFANKNVTREKSVNSGGKMCLYFLCFLMQAVSGFSIQGCSHILQRLQHIVDWIYKFAGLIICLNYAGATLTYTFVFPVATSALTSLNFLISKYPLLVAWCEFLCYFL